MKTQTFGFLIVTVLLASLMLGACGLMLSALPISGLITSGSSQAGTSTPGAVVVQPTSTVEPPQPTPTVIPPTPVVTVEPATPGTVPDLPTSNPPQPTPTPTAVPVPCEWAQFVKDVTVPDGSIFRPDTSFTKTWRIKNIGACTWTTGYDLVFTGGDLLDAQKVVSLPVNVLPGATIDLSVKMAAPEKAGDYSGYWKLRNTDGVLFGLGGEAKTSFWVSIQVRSPRTRTVLDFADTYCDASWQTGAGSLSCTAGTGLTTGFVAYLADPALENRHENEPTIWVHPDLAADGWISGVYPVFKVKEGDRFRAWVGCLADREGCKVEFRLDYQKTVDGPVKNLGTWIERYDGEVSVIDLDLSELQGKNIQFILSVRVLKNPDKADGFWFVPRIDRITE